MTFETLDWHGACGPDAKNQTLGGLRGRSMYSSSGNVLPGIDTD